MKKQFRTAMLSTACMLIVAVMSLTGVTYAWFTTSSQAEVTGMHLGVQAANGGIEVAQRNNSTWGTLLDLAAIDGSGAIMSGIYPVSTADAEYFVRLDQYNPQNSEEIRFVEDSANYMVQELSLRNTGTQPITINFANTYIMDTEANKAIGKAGRIAIFLEKEGDDGLYYDLVGIMAPYYNATAETGYYSVDTAATYGVNSSAIVKTEGETTDNTSNNPYVTFNNKTSSNTYLTTYSLTDPSAIQITLPAMIDNEHVVVNIKVVVWVEGQDSECTVQNAAGQFDVHLMLNKNGEQLTPQEQFGKQQPNAQ